MAQKAEEEREKLTSQLQQALAEVKTLSGLLPTCASCKNIRDDKGNWNQMEVYIRDHSRPSSATASALTVQKNSMPRILKTPKAANKCVFSARPG